MWQALYSKDFTNTTLFNPHKITPVKEIVLSPFHSGVNQGAERLNRHTAGK